MAQTEHEWEALRKQYLLTEDETYLNTGSWGATPRPVFDAYVSRQRRLESNPTRGRPPLLKELEASRSQFASYLNIQAEDLAFLPNVTAAINMVVNGLDWELGDEILTTDQEYGAILNCLDNASKRWGVSIVSAKIPVPPESPSDILDALEALIKPRTKLIVCSHIATRTGMIAPIKEISDLAHRNGALAAFDGAHAPGMVELDLAATGVDFYGGNCHKWLCSPKGVGFLYAHPRVQSRLHHLIVSWGYDSKGMKLTLDRPTINDAPAMWGLEMWGTADLAAQASVGDAVSFQQSIGVSEVAARGRELSWWVRELVESLDWAVVVSPSHPDMFCSITTCELSGLEAPRLSDALFEDYGITIPVFVERTGCYIRVSTHVYNTRREVEYLFQSLKTLRST